MVIDSTITLTLQIKERMMRYIYMCSLVSFSKILNLELVIFGKSIDHFNIKIARMAILTVCMKIVQHNGCIVYVLYIPYYHIKTLETSVKSLAIIILWEIINLAIY